MQNPSNEKTSFNPSRFSAGCFNHMSHGGSNNARSYFLADEVPAEYVALLESAFEEFQPFSDHDASIVDRCVHDNWILLRRTRAADNAEVALYLRQPDSASWSETDLSEMTRFARYKTEAARSYDRSLHCLRTIKKLHSDEQRWQLHLESAKKKLEFDIERFEMAKQRHNERTVPIINTGDDEEDLPDLTNPPAPPSSAPAPNAAGQTLYLGIEKGKTVIFETTPSNADLRQNLQADQQVCRTYNFVGKVPPEYQHLVTSEAYTFGASTCVHKLYTFKDWSDLTVTEKD